MRALRAATTPEFAPNPLAWLYRTTTNLCLNRLRDAKRRGELLSTWTQEEFDSDASESRIAVHRILEQIPEELQDVAVYYYVDELTHEEIASVIGVSRRTVGNRLSTFHELVGALLTNEVAS